MLRPTDIENLKGDKSRYAVVVGVAKRARQIADEAEQEGIILVDKTVSLAIRDFTSGEYKIVVPDEKEEAAKEEAERHGA